MLSVRVAFFFFFLGVAFDHNPPTNASPMGGITAVCHHAWLSERESC
jgi:hypothetical protein